MEIIRDSSLFQAVRQEALESLITDSSMAEPRFDVQKLTSKPLLQSIYTETLRLHISYTVTRTALQPPLLDGYHIDKGSIVPATTQNCHREEAVWSTGEHDAGGFWAARHLRSSRL
ncbi:hypothetical protein F5Y06DRAFT_268458 [Hypoxylon sp. FL0890]|nr:hypothetical protein F5Y06DRAFT_268458 [Hypoxylon sp. FL0890]